MVPLAGSVFQDANVWPTSTAGRLDPGPHLLMHGGGLLSKHETMCSVNVSEHALLHIAPVSVKLRLSCGRHRMTLVPRYGTVADLRAVALSEERNDDFVLMRGRHLLDDVDAELADVGIKEGSEITVRRVWEEVSVLVGDRNITWRIGRRRLRFSDIVDKLAAATGLSLRTLNRKTLFCVGCGRRVRKLEESFQTLPVECCRVLSLRLAELTAPAKRVG